MSEFTYTGPSSTLFLFKDKSEPLVTGKTYSDLDENHPQVKNLIAHKLLVKSKTQAALKGATSKSTTKSSSSAEDDAARGAEGQSPDRDKESNTKQTNDAKGKQS